MNVYLDFELKDDTVKYLLKIQDTGIGIPDGAKERMFKAFSQVQQSNSREFGGTGLGLSITKKILQLMDGSISFESEFGKGTIFYVDLTLKKGTYIETNNKSSETQAERVSSSGLITARVLVAEDNPTNQLVIKRMLESIGIKGHVVATGGEVLDALREADFDLVLMDCQMPEMDGYEATQKIRKSESLPNKIPIIALTANATKDDEKKCYDSGMNAYLAKPINKKLLEKTLRKFLK